MAKIFSKERLLVAAIFVSVAIGTGSNYYQQYSVDRSKLPDKVEKSKGFQRWITNLKNKDMDYINGDDFTLIEENEIYNTKWMKVYSSDDEIRYKEYLDLIEKNKNIKKIIYSPSERLFIDYRMIERDGYKPNEVRFYGLRDDKIIDAKVLDCSEHANCYFDRAYFLQNNEVFAISEFSRNIDKKDVTSPICLRNQECTYSIKIHVIDLINNSRLVYESKPFNIVLENVIPDL